MTFFAWLTPTWKFSENYYAPIIEQISSQSLLLKLMVTNIKMHTSFLSKLMTRLLNETCMFRTTTRHMVNLLLSLSNSQKIFAVKLIDYYWFNNKIEGSSGTRWRIFYLIVVCFYLPNWVSLLYKTHTH